MQIETSPLHAWVAQLAVRGSGRPLESRVASGFPVLSGWLDDRVDVPATPESKLELIRPPTWTDRLTKELLEVVWSIEATLDIATEQNKLLSRVTSAPTFRSDELPDPTEADRSPPDLEAIPDEGDDQLGLDLETD